MHLVLNNTKWLEIQEAMYGLKFESPKWRSKYVDNDYISDWDGEWFYHFSESDFSQFQWVEIKTGMKNQKAKVHSILKRIHVPGVETKHGYKVFGYIKNGVPVDYI